VVLPAAYVAEHVELAYASSAHRAQGRTVDTAHAFVTSTTTREALYVLATRGRESNQLYVDTHYDPDPQTAHDQATEAVSAKDVLAGVLRNEGADVAAHDMIRREQSEAEGMERLSAEYLTLATMAQSERWDSLLAQSGLSDGDLAAARTSAAHGPSSPPSGKPKPAGSMSKTPSLAWWPAGPWPTPPMWRRCCTAGWSVGPRQHPAATGEPTT
jgi:hypothetical protein